MPTIKYVDAINQALYELLEDDERIVIVGAACVDSPWYVGGTLEGLKEIFPKRIIDCPCSENAVMGMAVGMAVMGMRPIVVFPRMDFMLYAFDPLINQAAKLSYMTGGKLNVPMMIWAIINRGGSQGAQHSQDFTWLFEKIPGLTVMLPRSPVELKEQFTFMVNYPNPVIFVDNREYYSLTDETWGQRRTQTDWESTCPMPASEVLERAYFEKMDRSLY